MSSLYLYAITDQPETPVPAGPPVTPGVRGASAPLVSPGVRGAPAPTHSETPGVCQTPGVLTGLEGASLIGLAYQDIGAVVSPLTTGEAPLTEDNLWQHEAVVEALMASRTVLPMRFGTVLANEAAVQSALAARYADFVTSLKRVHGRVELGLWVLWDDRRPQTADRRGVFRGRRSAVSGRAYLLARLEEDRQARARRLWAEALVAPLHTPLARLATESTRQVLAAPRSLLKAAYLIDRDRVAAFRREVEALSAANPTLRFFCTGPWPAYSFMTTGIPATDGEERKDGRA